MPLAMIGIGEKRQIIKIKGKDEIRKFLGNLGFVEGADVTVISENLGNLIVNIKNSRVAIDRTMALRIIV